MKLLVIGDFHLKHDPSKSQAYQEWESRMYLHVIDQIAKQKVDAVVFAGDLTDGTELTRELEYIDYMLDKIKAPIWLLDGNHERIQGIKEVKYLHGDILRDYWKSKGVRVFEYDRVDNILLCSHKHIAKLETEREGADLLISHIRLGEEFGCEIEPANLIKKFKLSVMGDIHTPSTLYSDRVVYTNSPIDVKFLAENEYVPRGAIIVDTETLEWGRVSFLKDNFRKLVLYFDSVSKIAIPDRKDCWFKLVVEDTSVNLKELKRRTFDNADVEAKKIELVKSAKLKDISAEVLAGLKGKKMAESFQDYALLALKDSGKPELEQRLIAGIAELEIG